MTRHDYPDLLISIIVIVFFAAALIGYVINIATLMLRDWDGGVTVGAVLQIIGIFVPPLGAIAGWVSLFA